MALLSNGSYPTTIPATTQNATAIGLSDKAPSHRWEFLVAVLATAISASILIALLAKFQVVRRYLASYRHTRLREGDTVSQCDPSGLEIGFSMQGGPGRRPHPVHQMSEEDEDDDDGFIEDNYIQASERERAEKAAEEMRDTEEEEEEMDDIQFTIG